MLRQPCRGERGVVLVLQWLATREFVNPGVAGGAGELSIAL